jgi:hypothetical protein
MAKLKIRKYCNRNEEFTVKTLESYVAHLFTETGVA